jgi:hypothetical protein
MSNQLSANEKAANNFETKAEECKKESVLFLTFGLALFALIFLGLAVLSGLLFTPISVQPTTSTVQPAPSKMPFALLSAEYESCDKPPPPHDARIIALCRKILELKGEQSGLEKQINRARLKNPDVLIADAKQNVEMFRVNSENTTSIRKQENEFQLSKERLEIEKDKWNSIQKITTSSIWRITLVVIGFYVMSILFARSASAKSREVSFQQLAIVARLLAGQPTVIQPLIDLIQTQTTTVDKPADSKMSTDLLSVLKDVTDSNKLIPKT